MSLTDDLIAAVQSSGADAGKKSIAADFLTNAAPIIETLGPSLFDQLLHAAAGGGVPDAVVENLNAQQVGALLAHAASEMDVLLQNRSAQRVAWDAAMAQLQSIALGTLARIVLGAI